MAESDGEFTVTMDLPGFERDDIDLRVTDHTLHVEAKREEERTEEEKYIKGERSRRSVSRTIQLPEPIAEQEAEASYQNGVLTVTVPKALETREEDNRVPIE